MMRSLLTDPLWKEEDLGSPIPNVRHACSVCFPTWQSVIDYEEGREKVTRLLEAGYPRFVLHPDVSALFAKVRGEYAMKGQEVMVYPTRESAQRAQRFLELREAKAIEIKSFNGVFVLVFPKDSAPLAKTYWRYTGEGISSRQAQRILENDKTAPSTKDARAEYADFLGDSRECVHLWKSGMTAMFESHRYVTSERTGKKTLQIDFPYVDAMRVQQSFGSGVVFLSQSKGEDFQIALERIRDREFAAVYTEVASNPLLKVADIEEISKACRMSQTPFIVDDTVASHYNVDVLPYADVVTTSLTKWVSGKGDVMAGSTRINPESVFAKEFQLCFDDQSPTGSSLFWEDEVVLLENLKGFESRMQQVNQSGLEIAEFLHNHSAVDEVFYPTYTTEENYNNVKTAHGGYGGLISITLKNEKKAPLFYDRLRLTKGPSLGTEFTLVSPYTMLAHYDEIDFAETNNVSKNLIRFSIGIEPSDHLIAVIKEALELL